MEYEDLDIAQIVVGANIRGAYRGEKTHRILAFGSEPERKFVRVFLDTGGGPAAVQVNEKAVAQIQALDVAERWRVDRQPGRRRSLRHHARVR